MGRPRRNCHHSGYYTLTKKETFFYNLSLPISTAIIGCDSVEQVAECVELARSFTPLSQAQMAALGSKGRTCCQAGPVFPAHASLRIDKVTITLNAATRVFCRAVLQRRIAP
jgi:hypothetical protein